MRYMLLVYRDEKGWTKMSEEQKGTMVQQHAEFTESIRKSGAFQAGDGLQPASTATTVRVKNGRMVRTDGPFAETKEQLGGYYVVEAKNLEDAIAIAARIPSGPEGRSIEVRPIMEGAPPK